MLLLLLGLAAAAAVTIFVLEVAALMLLGADSRTRPSVAIAALAGLVRSGFYYAYYLACLVTDVPRFLKDAALLVRDLFFRFVPREVIFKAWGDLSLAYKALRQAPLGIVDGLRDGLKEVKVPILSILLVLFTSLLAPVIVELVLMALGVETRLTTVTHWLAEQLFYVGHQSVYFFHYVWNLKDLVVDFLAHVLTWIDVPVIRRTTYDVYHGLWDMAAATAKGGAVGACRLFGRNESVCTDTMSTQRNDMFYVIASLVVAAMFILGRYRKPIMHFCDTCCVLEERSQPMGYLERAEFEIPEGLGRPGVDEEEEEERVTRRVRATRNRNARVD